MKAMWDQSSMRQRASTFTVLLILFSWVVLLDTDWFTFICQIFGWLVMCGVVGGFVAFYLSIYLED